MHLSPRLRFTVVTVVVLASAFAAGRAVAYQGHMENALGALQNAGGELQQAARDKGGYRTHAAQLISEAKYEVQAGIQYAAAHSGEGN